MRATKRLRAAILAAAAALCLLVGGPAGAAPLYWEYPREIGPGSFPLAASGGGLDAVAWQEAVDLGGGAKGAALSLIVREAGGAWSKPIRVGEPVPYSSAGAMPRIASIAVDARGGILVAIGAKGSVILHHSADRGSSFRRSSQPLAGAESYAPRAFAAEGGGWILFATMQAAAGDASGTGGDASGAGGLTIAVSRSADGAAWGPFEDFLAGDAGLSYSFLPSYAGLGGAEYVVFQSRVQESGKFAFQLFGKRAEGGGWSKAVRITTFGEGGEPAAAPGSFDNQRPSLAAIGGALSLAWERTTSSKTSIYYAPLGADFSVAAPGYGKRVSDSSGPSSDPQLFALDGKPALLWFDFGGGTYQVYYARSSEGWINRTLADAEGGRPVESWFARAIPGGSSFEAVWERRRSGSAPRIAILAPDRSVAAPAPKGGNFAPGKAQRGDVARVKWEEPRDSSGIAGYSWSWSQDPAAEPTGELRTAVDAAEAATKDGAWWFAIKARDAAGNWSATARIEFVRDTTPPPPPVIDGSGRDLAGYMPSNTLKLAWAAAPGEAPAGFTWSLDYLGASLAAAGTAADPAELAGFEQAALERAKDLFPPPRPLGAATSLALDDAEDGVYLLSVRAFDAVGNVSETVRMAFRLDKFVPYTAVSYVDARRDEIGTATLVIRGRGFLTGGRITEVYIDRDGKEPWDRAYSLAAGDFSLRGDREIDGPRVEDADEGAYRIGLVHSGRGLYLTAPILTIDSSGTVKYGDFAAGAFKPSWAAASPRGAPFQVADLLVAAAALFCVFGILITSRLALGVAREGVLVDREVRALLTGGPMPLEKKEKEMTRARRRGAGLRVKFALFTSAIVFLVVALVALALGYTMTGNQERILLGGLKDKINVFEESVVAGARSYFALDAAAQANNQDQISQLVKLRTALPEASSVTITGYQTVAAGAAPDTEPERIFAYYDPDIASKVDLAKEPAPADGSAPPATPQVTITQSVLKDELSPRLPALIAEVQAAAQAKAGPLIAERAALSQEAGKLIGKADAASVARRTELTAGINKLNEDITAAVSALTAATLSEPAFPEDRVSRDRTDYLFYKPILVKPLKSDGDYYRGMVRVGVSTKAIIASIDAATASILRLVGLIAVVALGAGVLGSLVLSGIIIKPIRILARGVALIRDTEDKEELAGASIAISTRDEIADLADTVNQMTRNLVTAAKAAKELTIGKEIQKRFMTLETDARGRKLTTVGRQDPRVELFGYYEGAKGVSGDYFDFAKLDDTHYAMIKCDVAGKGVPAALIMIEVATLFLNHFRSWKPGAAGSNLTDLVVRINDLIEERGFEGRFAAFSMAILDTATGAVQFCNAGDNIVRVFRAQEARMTAKKVPSGPTAGSFPSDLVMMQTGFPQAFDRLGAGDILFLYTDGVEEAKRHFRSATMEVVPCEEGEKGSDHGTHVSGQDNEEFGNDRIEEIIDAVMARGSYRLEKAHLSAPEDSTFDFSGLEGSLEDCVIAMVSVEKVFRMYEDPKAGPQDRIIVDRKIDAFLERTFSGYARYCKGKQDMPDHPEYVYWTGVREDDQYDDLTILAVKKK